MPPNKNGSPSISIMPTCSPVDVSQSRTGSGPVLVASSVPSGLSAIRVTSSPSPGGGTNEVITAPALSHAVTLPPGVLAKISPSGPTTTGPGEYGTLVRLNSSPPAVGLTSQTFTASIA